jgi:DNA-binding NarL/FixJ family response regulator
VETVLGLSGAGTTSQGEGDLAPMVNIVITECRALLVDDDPFTRTVLSSALRELGVTVFATVGTAADAMNHAKDVSCDLAVLDLDLGEGPSGIDVAHGLRRLHPNIAIIILSTYAEPRLMGRKQQVLPVGTRFVVKQTISESSSLETVLLDVLRSPHQLIEPLATSAVHELSDLQIEIIRLISEGKSNAEIARQVIMEEGSVEKAIARIIKKLKVKADRTQNQRVMLAQYFFQLTKASYGTGD